MFLLGFMASFLLVVYFCMLKVLLYVIQNYIKIFYLNVLSLGYFRVNIILFMYWIYMSVFFSQKRFIENLFFFFTCNLEFL